MTDHPGGARRKRRPSDKTAAQRLAQTERAREARRRKGDETAAERLRARGWLLLSPDEVCSGWRVVDPQIAQTIGLSVEAE